METFGNIEPPFFLRGCVGGLHPHISTKSLFLGGFISCWPYTLIAGLIFGLRRMGLQAALQEIVDENGQAAASNADRGTDKDTPIAKT